MTLQRRGAGVAHTLHRFAPAIAGAVLLLAGATAWAAPAGPDVLPGVIPGSSSGLTVKSQILVLMTILGLLPVMVMMMTSFTRFVIVLSLLRQALGLQQGLPNRIITGVALILTLLVMRPVGEQVWNEAFVPYDKDKISLEQALKIAEVPLSRFMLAQTSKTALAQIAHLAGEPAEMKPMDRGFTVKLAAFVLSFRRRRAAAAHARRGDAGDRRERATGDDRRRAGAGARFRSAAKLTPSETP
jgi:flagellar biosynthetic protein FliP